MKEKMPCLLSHGVSLCILSSVLLILSFPKTDLGSLAWICLVPFFAALEGKRPLAAFRLGYMTGFLFFIGTLYWFIHVTLPGMILLNLFLALYFALFAAGYSLMQKESFLKKIILLPSLWVALEYIRGHFLSGFGWVSLGHSQYKNLPMIQIADLTGVPGISYLIVMVNCMLKEVFCVSKKDPKLLTKALILPSITVIGIILLVLGYGEYRLNQAKNLPKVKVAVIGANIPLEMRWDRKLWPAIMKRHISLTQEAARENPQLIIWTESSFPEVLGESAELLEGLKAEVRRLRVPLLVGVVSKDGDKYFNSAILISAQGEMAQQYDKLHLVPFGEYIPLRNVFPFLSKIVPIDDFTAGKDHTLFPILNRQGFPSEQKFNFSILICFEDTLSELSREFVLRGSQLLVNITNDAWFQDSKAPFLHLQAAVFRTVENRRSLIRAANTGVSCFIDPQGKIIKYLEDKRFKKTFVEGYAISEVALDQEVTFYTKFGDIFTYFCFGCILIIILIRARGRKIPGLS